MSVTHGHTIGGMSPTYRSWTAMRSRCTYPSQPQYADYGGRGITVCERWQSFANFLADMGERPGGMTLDRADTDGNYEPGNCRWATAAEQQRNKRPGRHRNAVKTHCPAGHPYDKANTYVTKEGYRLCRTCHRERERARRQERVCRKCVAQGGESSVNTGVLTSCRCESVASNQPETGADSCE